MSLNLGLCTCLKDMGIFVSGPKGCVSLSKEFLNQEEIIFEEIKKAAAKAGGSFKDFSKIVSVRGPGRFTGMRISYTLAGVYSVLSNAGVYGLSVHDCLAFNAFEYFKEKEKFEIACLSRAFKDEFYLSYYLVSQGKLKRKTQIFWLKENILKDKLRNYKGIIIGEKKDYPQIYSLAQENSNLAPDEISAVLPKNIIKAGFYFNEKNISPIYAKPAKYENLK